MWSFLPLVENEIRRGAFYMRPRKFALPQAGTDGYGIRPYVFLSGAPATRFTTFIISYFLFIICVPGNTS